MTWRSCCNRSPSAAASSINWTSFYCKLTADSRLARMNTSITLMELSSELCSYNLQNMYNWQKDVANDCSKTYSERLTNIIDTKDPRWIQNYICNNGFHHIGWEWRLKYSIRGVSNARARTWTTWLTIYRSELYRPNGSKKKEKENKLIP